MARVDEQIRRARRESGLSQEALAERIGVPPAALHRYEEGAEISSRHLELIAVATGKPVSFFLDGAGASSQNGTGLGARVKAAIAWLSDAPRADPEVAALLASVEAQERALAEREQRLAERERALAEREQAAAATTEDRAREPDRPSTAAEKGFNLDALEHTLDERADEFPERAAEWRAYTVFLREFVQADGELPATFNTLVREVFRDLLARPEGD
jgi:transcriptional regulator with XRE-family HTH domain